MRIPKPAHSLALVAALIAAAVPARAAGINPTSTFSGLTWAVASSASYVATCSRLVLDASGDFAYGSAFAMSGFLNCSGGSYSVSGSAYWTTAGTLNMTANVGVNRVLFCQFNTQMASACLFYEANANSAGTVLLTFL
jgi:hypothetical protein